MPFCIRTRYGLMFCLAYRDLNSVEAQDKRSPLVLVASPKPRLDTEPNTPHPPVCPSPLINLQRLPTSFNLLSFVFADLASSVLRRACVSLTIAIHSSLTFSRTEYIYSPRIKPRLSHASSPQPQPQPNPIDIRTLIYPPPSPQAPPKKQQLLTHIQFPVWESAHGRFRHSISLRRTALIAITPPQTPCE